MFSSAEERPEVSVNHEEAKILHPRDSFIPREAAHPIFRLIRQGNGSGGGTPV
jgi:hypothetical protein